MRVAASWALAAWLPLAALSAASAQEPSLANPAQQSGAPSGIVGDESTLPP